MATLETHEEEEETHDAGPQEGDSVDDAQTAVDVSEQEQQPKVRPPTISAKKKKVMVLTYRTVPMLLLFLSAAMERSSRTCCTEDYRRETRR